MNKHKIILVIICVVVVALIGVSFGWDFLVSVFTKRHFANATVPAVVVSSGKVKQINYSPRLNAVGQLVATQGVAVNSQVAGQISKIFFKSGEMVKVGDPLVQLSDSIAQQTLLKDLALLRQYRLTYNRTLNLYQTHASARSDLDKARSQLDQQMAQVATDRIAIHHKHIVAPFSGKLGIRSINIGQYITAGAALISLQAIDRLYVDFSLPEQEITLVKIGLPVSIEVSGYPKTVTGKVVAVDSEASTDVHMILVRGEILNPNYALLPNEFAQVQVLLPTKKNVLVIPKTAVSYNIYGDLVYVISSDKKSKALIAKQRFITVGDTLNKDIIVTSGVNVGEQVVTSGQIKLRNGASVKINNSVKL